MTNKADYEEKKRQREDVLAHCRIASAVPQTDLDGQNLEISEMLGSAARDSVLAADGSGLLLLSEDQGLRQWANTALDIGTSWLQPVMLLAKDQNLVSIEDYTKFIVDCLNRGFTYVSMDSHTLFTQAKADGFDELDTVKRMLQVVGGKNADLVNNMGVAALFTDLVLQGTKSEHLRDRYASLVLDAFTAPRKDQIIDVMKALTGQVSICPLSLIDHTFWWFVGRMVGTPQFAQHFEEAKRSLLRRPIPLRPAIEYRQTVKGLLMITCYPR